MKSSFTLLLLSISYLVFAQTASPQFGRVSQAEVDLREPPKFPNSKAVVIYDFGDIKFERNKTWFEVSFTQHRRIKILKHDAEENAEVEIPLYCDSDNNWEHLKFVEARTYNPVNGVFDIKEVKKSAIYEEKINDRLRVKKFVFPDVKKGSILEFRYEKRSPFFFSLPTWYFQSEIPTFYSQLKVHLTPFYSYSVIANEIDFFYTKDESSGNTLQSFGGWGNAGHNWYTMEYRDRVYTYALKDIPAFTDESYITSKSDYIKKIDFQLSKISLPRRKPQDIITTWPDYKTELLEHEKFGEYLDNSLKIAKRIIEKELSLKGLGEQEKTKTIVDWVRKNYIWNKKRSEFSSQSAKSFQKSKLGNSADLNLFLIAMLRAAGIAADPVVSSTRDHGKINPEYPFDHFFNYVICYAQLEQSLLLDATATHLPYSRLPLRAINDHGLLVNDEKTEWVLTNSTPVSNKLYIINITPDTQEHKSMIKLGISSNEYQASYYRNTFSDDINDLESYFENYFDRIEKINTRNFEQEYKPYLIQVEGSRKLEHLRDKLLIQPFLGLGMTKNLLTQEERSYPVDFIFPEKINYKINVVVPENYRVLALPKPYSMEDELLSIALTYIEHSGKIEINGTYEFKKGIYPPEDYSELKAHIDLIVKKFNSELIFQKDTQISHKTDTEKNKES